jgi:polygalacturonase
MRVWAPLERRSMKSDNKDRHSGFDHSEALPDALNHSARRLPVEVLLSPPLRNCGPAKRKRFASSVYNILDFGASSGVDIDSTSEIQNAIDTCALAGGGTVLVPAGLFRSGALWLRSHVTLELDAGAKLRGMDDINLFPSRTSDWEGPRALPMHTGLINAENVENIAITGRGTVDGSGQMWWDLFEQGNLRCERPKLVRLINCRDVLIDGVSFINSPMWTINPVACNNVTITRVTLRNPQYSPNTDGINPDSCSNVHIGNCHIDVGDDCIAIKAGTETDGRRIRKACENIVVSGCTMLHGHGGVVIGSEITGGVRNVAIGNCVFRGTDRGIRIKARRGRGSAVEDVRIDNIIMDEVICPLVVNQFYHCGVEDPRLVTDVSPHPVTSQTPSFRRLRFSNISARRVKFAAAYVLGLPEMFIDDVVFDNISIFLDPHNTEAGQPAMSPVTPELCRAGFRIQNARGVRLRSVDIRGQIGPAVSFDNAADVILRDLSGSDDLRPAEVHLLNTRSVRGDDSVKLLDGDSVRTALAAV